MVYYSYLFSPESWKVFLETERSTVGLRKGSRYRAKRVSKTDYFVCYLTGLKRWCGVLEVTSDILVDDSPLAPDRLAPDWYAQLPIRFFVKPVVILEPKLAVPIKDPQVWQALSITKEHEMKGSSSWSGFFRQSLSTFTDEDGRFLVKLLKEQQANPKSYPLTTKDQKELTRTQKVQTLNPVVEVEVPEQDDEDKDLTTEQQIADSKTSADAGQLESRKSFRYQAKVAEIGVEMGFKIWVPTGDRDRVLKHVTEDKHEQFLSELPLTYDGTSLQTIKQIDVLWLKGRAMSRAFEIEHATAIYSGLLRMADLLALQPNIRIRLHIVAPVGRREKVLRQIRRPAFSRLKLSNYCTFLSYDAVRELAQKPDLSYMHDEIIDKKYAEYAEVE